MLLVLPCIVLATPVPETGQTQCYDNAVEITCPFPGEDFHGQDAQYSINPQSYTKLDANGNDLPDNAPWPWVMVRDNITGLIWEMKQDKDDTENYANPHDADNTYVWSDSIGDGTGTEDFIHALNSEQFGSYSDWRLPTIKELSSLIDSSIPYPGPIINTDYFANTQPGVYWSSPTYADSTTGAHQYVRAVRGGQCGLHGTFVDNGNGTVTNTGTGLMWQKATAPGRYLWQAALLYCEGLFLGGHNDWRLPSRNELQSIVDYNTAYPAFDPIFSYNDNGLYDFYWSSTTFAANNWRFAWVVSSKTGSVTSSYKRDFPLYVRAVRGGQCESFEDVDGDCRIDCIDNCPSTPNGLDLGTCTKGTITQPCTSNEQCGTGGFCSMHNEDADSDYLGDACDECTDTDKDGYSNPGFLMHDCPYVPYDNCPTIANPTQEDSDSDNWGDACDNCPRVSNADQEDTDGDTIGNACDPCPHDYDNDSDADGLCGDVDNCPGTTNPLQEDSYPPQENGIGDACECEADFMCDGDVDGSDASMFKFHFGRSLTHYQCTALDPCRGDFNCDGDVDGTDAVLFKQDFGRSSMQNPCPACASQGPWCGMIF